MESAPERSCPGLWVDKWKEYAIMISVSCRFCPLGESGVEKQSSTKTIGARGRPAPVGGSNVSDQNNNNSLYENSEYPSRQRRTADQHPRRRPRKKRGSRGRTILKVLGTLFLVGLCTGAVLCCFGAYYVQTVILPEVEVSMDDFQLGENSIMYYQDKETGRYVEMTTLLSSTSSVWVDLEEMPEYLPQAAVAIEDQRFYTHPGVDWKRTAKAVLDMFLGNDISGGSTITQQLIKNMTDYNETTAVSYTHLPPCGQNPGTKLVNESITYSDTEGNVVDFPEPTVAVECDVVVNPEECPLPVDLTIQSCSDSVVVDMGDVYLESMGTILQMDVTVKNVCPKKRVALAAILTEVDENGMEYQRGTKTVTIPAHNYPSCRDVLVKCMKFVLPKDLDVSGGSTQAMCSPRQFKARFIAHNIDSDYRCCESVLTL